MRTVKFFDDYYIDIIEGYEKIFTEYENFLDSIFNISNFNMSNLDSYIFYDKINLIYNQNKKIILQYRNKYYNLCIKLNYCILDNIQNNIDSYQFTSEGYYCPLQKYLSSKKLFFSFTPLMVTDISNSKIILDNVDISSLNFMCNGDVNIDNSWSEKIGKIKMYKEKIFVEYSINNRLYYINRENCDVLNFKFEDIEKVLLQKELKEYFYFNTTIKRENNIINYLLNN